MDKTAAKVRKPSQKRSLETKEKIINAGIKLFSDKGYFKTNSKDIIKEAGLGIGSFYDYFNDKKSLFLEIMRIRGDDFFYSFDEKIIQDCKNLNDSRKIIKMVIQFVLNRHENIPGIHDEIFVMRHYDEDIKKMIEEWEVKTTEKIVEFISLFKSHLRPKNLKAAAYIIFITVEENIHAIKSNKSQTEEKDLINELEDCIYRYIFKE